MNQMVRWSERIYDAYARLSELPNVSLRKNEPLRDHTRFGIGGPADLMASVSDAAIFSNALGVAQSSGLPWAVIGGGTNLVVSDEGFRGLILKFTADGFRRRELTLDLDAGAVLQDAVDFSISEGLRGLETMTGIPGWVGAAVYGNAGAYGHSISERITAVRFLDNGSLREFDNAACEFRYRESAFKRRKEWIIIGCELAMTDAASGELAEIAREIRRVRDQKYPPTMRCAGSIFKNLLVADLTPQVQAHVPEKIVREGKAPSAWFLEQAGAKGIRAGDIQVATYHANLIFNDGAGTARDLVAVIRLLKRLVRERFDITLEEEVQYVGEFPPET